MRKIIISVIVLLLYIGNYNVFCQGSKFIGKYKCIPNIELPSDSIILILNNNSFEYDGSRFYHHDVGLFNYCNSIGRWSIEGNKIILNSNIKSVEAKDYNRLLSSNTEHKDSIKIEIINFSNKSKGISDVILWNKNKKQVFEIFTPNKYGQVTIPAKGYKYVSYNSGQNSPVIWIDSLKGGNFYQFVYIDCYTEIFSNKKLTINNNVLILDDYYWVNKRLFNLIPYRKKIKYRQEYIKIE